MHLTAFNARALTDVAAAVKSLESQGAAELVLDLRDNRGGLVQEGIEIAKLFLEGGAAHHLLPLSAVSVLQLMSGGHSHGAAALPGSAFWVGQSGAFEDAHGDLEIIAAHWDLAHL